MKKRRIVSVLALSLCLIILLAGCSPKSQPSTTDTSGSDAEKATFVLKDDLGREVTIPVNPQRVLALNSSMIETVFDLGVIPIGKVSEYLIDRPEAADLPSIGMENSPNIEIINQLAPDLIIAHVRNHAQFLDSLEETGASVFYVDPSTADNQLVGKIDLIAQVLDRQEEAKAYSKAIKDKAARLREKLAQSPVKTALMIQGGSQNIMAAQTFCFWGRLMADLGLENIVPESVASTTRAGFVTFDMETILQADPDAVFILQPGFRSPGQAGQNGKKNPGATGTGSGKGPGATGTGSGQGPGATGTGPGKGPGASPPSMTQEELLAMYRDDPMWKELSAVKNGRLYIVPLNVSPGRINSLDALDVLAELIMPGVTES